MYPLFRSEDRLFIFSLPDLFGSQNICVGPNFFHDYSTKSLFHRMHGSERWKGNCHIRCQKMEKNGHTFLLKLSSCLEKKLTYAEQRSDPPCSARAGCPRPRKTACCLRCTAKSSRPQYDCTEPLAGYRDASLSGAPVNQTLLYLNYKQ